jgi:hypothetical protein
MFILVVAVLVVETLEMVLTHQLVELAAVVISRQEELVELLRMEMSTLEAVELGTINVVQVHTQVMELVVQAL